MHSCYFSGICSVYWGTPPSTFFDSWCCLRQLTGVVLNRSWYDTYSYAIALWFTIYLHELVCHFLWLMVKLSDKLTDHSSFLPGTAFHQPSFKETRRILAPSSMATRIQSNGSEGFRDLDSFKGLNWDELSTVQYLCLVMILGDDYTNNILGIITVHFSLGESLSTSQYSIKGRQGFEHCSLNRGLLSSLILGSVSCNQLWEPMSLPWSIVMW